MPGTVGVGDQAIEETPPHAAEPAGPGDHRGERDAILALQPAGVSQRHAIDAGRRAPAGAVGDPRGVEEDVRRTGQINAP